MTYVNLDNNSVKVLSGGTLLDSYDIINFIAGSNITITAATNPDEKRLDITIDATGGGSGLTQQQVEGLI